MYEGGCLCGQVRFRIEGEPLMSGRCCCLSCQKLSGGGQMESIAFPAAAFAVEGSLTGYDWTADSGGRVTTSFCARCGSPLFGKSTSMPGLQMVRAAALDDPEVYEPQMVVYAKRRQAWAPHDERLPAFEAMPPTGG